MSARNVLVGAAVLIIVAAAAFAALAWRSGIDPIEPHSRSDFDETTIEHGARLAALGNCMDCHTAPGGQPFAGGDPVPTPFGTIYGTNITPDPETGIGRWSEEAFIRAMREGVDREGRHLYPAFPYVYFTHATDDDLRALYAFLMTREPVRAEAPPNDLPTILKFRPLLAAWNLLFLDEGVYEPQSDKSEEWNRGAYLVAALGHCGGCHTPRNMFGAPRSDQDLRGGETAGWSAPALTDASTAPVPWTQGSLFRYLHRGISVRHGFAAGPMAPVVANLARASEEDSRAIAAYLADRMGTAETSAEDAAARAKARVAERPAIRIAALGGAMPADAGAAIFAGACASCHGVEGPLQFSARVNLALSTKVASPDPRNLINVILEGIHTQDDRQPLMPGFANTLTDAQIASVANYLRTQFAKLPPGEDLEQRVREARGGGQSTDSAQGN